MASLPTVLATLLMIANAHDVLAKAVHPEYVTPWIDGRDPKPGALLDWSLLPSSTCGEIMDDRISHGNATHPFEFPWMVVLKYIDKNELIDECGGSLINSRYVLTAAHCVKTAHPVQLLKVRLSEHHKLNATDCIYYRDGSKHCATEAYDVDIEEMIVHRYYTSPISFRHDIGLIRMAQAIEFTESVQPICLPVDEDVRKLEVPRYIVTGWGATEKHTTSHVLLQALIEHLPIPDCIQKFRENFQHVTVEAPFQFCAIGDGKVDSCSGDSGGPLGFSVSVAGTPRFVQFGIVSAGARACGVQNIPGIYTQVSTYMDWIVTNMRP